MDASAITVFSASLFLGPPSLAPDSFVIVLFLQNKRCL